MHPGFRDLPATQRPELYPIRLPIGHQGGNADDAFIACAVPVSPAMFASLNHQSCEEFMKSLYAVLDRDELPNRNALPKVLLFKSGPLSEQDVNSKSIRTSTEYRPGLLEARGVYVHSSRASTERVFVWMVHPDEEVARWVEMPADDAEGNHSHLAQIVMNQTRYKPEQQLWNPYYGTFPALASVPDQLVAIQALCQGQSKDPRPKVWYHLDCLLAMMDAPAKHYNTPESVQFDCPYCPLDGTSRKLSYTRVDPDTGLFLDGSADINKGTGVKSTPISGQRPTDFRNLMGSMAQLSANHLSSVFNRNFRYPSNISPNRFYTKEEIDVLVEESVYPRQYSSASRTTASPTTPTASLPTEASAAEVAQKLTTDLFG